MFYTSIKLQKKYAKKVGIAVNIPDVTLKLFCDMTEEFVKAASIQNQMVYNSTNNQLTFIPESSQTNPALTRISKQTSSAIMKPYDMLVQNKIK